MSCCRIEHTNTVIISPCIGPTHWATEDPRNKGNYDRLIDLIANKVKTNWSRLSAFYLFLNPDHNIRLCVYPKGWANYLPYEHDKSEESSVYQIVAACKNI